MLELSVINSTLEVELSDGVLEIYADPSFEVSSTETALEIFSSGEPVLEVYRPTTYLEISTSATLEIGDLPNVVYIPSAEVVENPTRGALDSTNRELWYVGWFDGNAYRIGRRDCADLPSGISYAEGTTDYVHDWDLREIYTY